ncbi:hypothetical protein OSTOST_23677, partial [Ostertagia ostertagi]
YCSDQACCQQTHNACNGKNFFEARASSSYVKMDGRWITKWPVAAEGIVGNDTVRLGAIERRQLCHPYHRVRSSDKVHIFIHGHGCRWRHGIGTAYGCSWSESLLVSIAPWIFIYWINPLFTVYMKTANGKKVQDRI